MLKQNNRSSRNSKRRQCSSKATYTSHIAIAGYGESEDHSWFVELRIKKGSRSLTTLVELDKLARQHQNALSGLSRLGVYLIAKPALIELIERIQNSSPVRADFTVATRLGWNGDAFVFPDEIIGPKRSKLRVYLDSLSRADIAKYRRSGDLKGARKLFRLGRGNSRFQCACTCALSAIVARELNAHPTNIQLKADPGTGKTGLGAVASSSWGWNPDPDLGNERGFGDSWNNTANNLEQIAPAYQHGFLFLDETRLAPKTNGSLGKTLCEAAMRLSGGVSRGRKTEPERSAWSISVLSTSNKSLDELAREEKVEIDDAYRDRLIDIPAPKNANGLFENLHGFGSVAELVKHMKELAGQHHGLLARRFVKLFVRWRQQDRKELKRWLINRQAFYLRHCREIVAAGRDLSRLHRRFATLYVTGRLAIRFGLFPWGKRELLQSLLCCERDHVESVIACAQTNHASAIEILRDHINNHKRDMVDLRTRGLPSRLDPTCPGYWGTKGGRDVFVLTSDCFERIFGNRQSAQSAKRELDQRGLLHTTMARGEPRFVIKYPLTRSRNGKPRRHWAVVISATITSDKYAQA